MFCEDVYRCVRDIATKSMQHVSDMQGGVNMNWYFMRELSDKRGKCGKSIDNY